MLVLTCILGWSMKQIYAINQVMREVWEYRFEEYCRSRSQDE